MNWRAPGRAVPESPQSGRGPPLENQLDALPEGIFAGLNNLRILALGNNRLTELNPGVFADLDDVEQLDLLRNRLTGLPPDVFANLGNLKLLLLGGKPVDRAAARSVRGHPRY